MKNSPTSDKLNWFLPLRLASFVIIFAIIAFWMRYPEFLQVQFITYSVLTLAFTILLALKKETGTRAVTVIVALQFLVEISLESGIIYATGNVNSSFSALFILTIVSASLVYRLVGTLFIASVVSLAYAFIIWLGLDGTIDPLLSVTTLKTIFQNSEMVFYSTFLHILIFYTIAFISGYLAERLTHQGEELRQTSNALRLAKLETDDILRHLNSGLLTIDAQGNIIYFNRAAERILEYSEDKVKGLRCSEVFSDRMPQLVDCLLDCINAAIKYPRKEITIESLAGVKVPLGVSTSILTEDCASKRGVIAIFSDLTEAKRLEAKIRHADRLAAVGELSASIAHEIRNPLASISGSVEVLSNELELSDENEKLMNLIVKESHRLSKILSEFLTYARIDRPAYHKVELCHLIGEVIEIVYHHESFNDKINIRFDTAESIVYAVGDEDLLKQLLINLTVNACESFEGGEGNVWLRLILKQAEGVVELYVEDNGPGIPPDVARKIYLPFYSTKKQGTGLGLSIVHRIVTALEIELGFDSRPEQGTTFKLTLKTYSSDKNFERDDKLSGESLTV